MSQLHGQRTAMLLSSFTVLLMMMVLLVLQSPSGAAAVSCNGTQLLTSNGSLITDGQGAYANRMNCSWMVYAPATYRVLLTFMTFSTESCCDHLSVYDGSSTAAGLLGEFSGTQVPSPLRTSGNTAYVTWVSDASITSQGFDVLVTFESLVCSGIVAITGNGSLITESPATYGNNMNCGWAIAAPQGYRVTLTFQTFNTETCCDFVRVFDGSDAQSRLVNTLSGSSLPPAQHSTGNHMFVSWTTDASVTYDGFSALVTFESLACTGLATVNTSGSIITESPTRYTNAMHCQWNVTAPAGAVVHLTFFNFSSESCCDKLYIYDGPTQASTLLFTAHGTYTTPPGPFNSTGSTLFLMWTTDSSVTSDGFTAMATFLDMPPQDRACSGEVTIATNGSVITDGAGAYYNSMNCQFLLVAPAGHRVLLTFTEFATESCCDFLSIYDGSTTSFAQLGHFSGNQLPPQIRSSHTVMLVTWQTDGSVTSLGFTAVVSFESLVCSGTITIANNASIIQESPGSYGNNMQCNWLVVAPVGYRIALVFYTFATEACCDFLTVYDGHDTVGTLLGQFSGRNLPNTVYSTGPSMFVRWTTDASVTNDGFSAQVVFQSLACTGMQTITTSGTFINESPTRYDNNMHCQWNITAPAGYTVQLYFVSFDSERTYDTLSVFDGPNNQSRLISRFSGSNLPAPVNSTSNTMFLMWVTDSSITSSGFNATVLFISPTHVIVAGSCNGTHVVTTNGSLITDGSPRDFQYMNNVDCTFVLQAPPGFYVRLSFNSFASEACCDFLTVYDGTCTASAMLGQFSGTSLPPSIRSGGNVLLVTWHTDVSVSYGGFNITVLFESILCSGFVTLASNNSVISPGHYANNMNCSWLVSAPDGFKVQLHFLNFSTETCCDFVNLYDGITATGSNKINSSLSGYHIPSDRFSTGSSMYITWTTDGSVAYGGVGFTAVAEFVPLGCSGLIHLVHDHDPISEGVYTDNMVCQWLVTAPAGYFVSLVFTSAFSSEANYDYLNVYDGTTATARTIASLTGNISSPAALNSTGSNMFVTWSTDQSGRGAGFNATVRFLSKHTGNVTGPCAGVTTITTNGSVISDGAGAYYNNMDCAFMIIAPVGRRVLLTFTEFQSEACCDFINIYDGPNTNTSVLGRFSGSQLPPQIRSSGHIMYVRWTTDSSVNYGGFSAVVSFESLICTGVISVNANATRIAPAPTTYTNNMNCGWEIHAPDGFRVVLTFLNFSTEYCCDIVRVYNGTSATAPLLGRYSGFIHPPPVVRATGTDMFVSWVTDSSVTSAGWAALAWFESLACQGMAVIDHSGSTISENPGRYGNNMNCQWNVTAPAGYVISLSFTEFDTETNYDTLIVYDGPSALPSRLIGNYSGHVRPANVTSTHNALFLVWTTDASVSFNGFNATVTFVPSSSAGPCSGLQVITSNNSVVTDGSLDQYLDSMSCNFLVVAPADFAVLITFSRFSSEACCDFLTLYDGTASNAAVLGQFSGSSLPPQIRSSGNTMYITWRTDVSVESDGFAATVTFESLVCQGVQTVATNGTVISASPSAYSNFMNCGWSITAPDGYIVTLVFTEFSTEACCDFVSLYDGSATTSRQIGNFSGSVLPAPQSSTGHEMFVSWATDASVTSTGFRATVVFQSLACSGLSIINETGSFISEEPGRYTSNQNCQWLVMAPANFRIMLIFTEFDTELNYDVVRVYDGSSAQSRSLGSFSGSTIPNPVNTTQNSLYLTWHSDQSINGNGFNATVVFIGGVCNGTQNITTNGSQITDGGDGAYLNNMNCMFAIRAPDGFRVLLDFVRFTSESCCDFLTIFDGTSVNSSMLDRVSGGSMPHQQRSTGPNMLVVWSTDYSVTSGGFLAVVTFQSLVCNGLNYIYNNNSVISDGPSRGQNSMDCSWSITAPEGYRVALEFAYFTAASLSDSLVIYDGANYTTRQISTLSGTSVPATQLSTGQSMFLWWHTDGMALYDGFMATAVFQSLACSGLKNITSPQFISESPGTYLNLMNCQWIISAPAGQRVVLTFASFETEATYDMLSVYDGSSATAHLLGNFSGTSLPPLVRSSGSFLYMTFVTDTSVTLGGFNASVTFEVIPSTTCVGTQYINSTGTAITDGAGPYSNNQNCAWVITAPAGFRVLLNFTMFDTEPSYDVVTVTDPLLNIQIGRFSGYRLPTPVLSSGPQMNISFATDRSVSYKGFDAVVTFVPMACQGLTTITNNGTLIAESALATGMNCLFNITAPDGYAVVLTFLNFQTSACCDMLHVYDGPAVDNSRILGSYSGPFPSTPVVNATSQYMVVQWTTLASGALQPGSFVTQVTFRSLACSGLAIINTSGDQISEAPGPYSNNMNCQWNVTAPSGYRVVLTFVSFASQRNNDYLSIYDGPSSRSALLERYSGILQPPPLRSSGSYMFLMWHSDFTVVNDGFNVTVTFESMACAGLTNVTANNAVITNDPTGTPYSNSQTCAWLVTAPPGEVVVLDFTQFGLDTDDDYVTVYDGAAEDPSKQIGRFSGTDMPPEQRSTGRYMFITFVTDYSGTAQGFRASVSFAWTQPTACPLLPDGSPNVQNIISNGTALGQPAGEYSGPLNCQWLIYAPTTCQVLLQFTGYDMPPANNAAAGAAGNLTLYDGSDASGQFLMQYSATSPAPSLNVPSGATATNTMFVVWTTGAARVSAGFSAVALFQCQACAGLKTITTSGATISDGFGDYHSHQSCQWLVIAPPNNIISLEFSEFDTEECCDHVKVYDGGSLDVGHPWVLSGSTLPPTIMSSGNQLLVTFDSDQGGNRAGFSAVVVFKSMVCHGLTASSLDDFRLSDVAGFTTEDTSCTWSITAPDYKCSVVQLTIESLSVNSSESLQIFDGPLGSTTLLRSYGTSFTGNQTATVTSTEPAMQILWSRGVQSQLHGAFTAHINFVHSDARCPVQPAGNTSSGSSKSPDLGLPLGIAGAIMLLFIVALFVIFVRKRKPTGLFTWQRGFKKVPINAYDHDDDDDDRDEDDDKLLEGATLFLDEIPENNDPPVMEPPRNETDE